MKTTVKQFVLTAPVLIAILVVCNSFKPAQRNSIANGGGIAGDIHFNLNAVEQKEGDIVGHIQYDGSNYNVECAEWFGSSAILYTDGGVAFLVTDNGEGSSGVADVISDPLAAQCGDELEPADFLNLNDVTSGNIQVKE
jgi:hypothetical protein